jgi:hypothetical protein
VGFSGRYSCRFQRAIPVRKAGNGIWAGAVCLTNIYSGGAGVCVVESPKRFLVKIPLSMASLSDFIFKAVSFSRPNSTDVFLPI